MLLQLGRARWVAVLFVLLAIIGCSLSAESKALVGKQLPYVKFFLMDGSPAVIEDYRGKQVVVFFWSTYCTKSPPMIERLNAFAGKMRGHGVEFLAVSLDEEKDVAKLTERIQAGHLNNLVHVFSGGGSYDPAYVVLKGEYLPYVVIFDETGRIVSVSLDDNDIYEYFNSSSVGVVR